MGDEAAKDALRGPPQPPRIIYVYARVLEYMLPPCLEERDGRTKVGPAQEVCCTASIFGVCVKPGVWLVRRWCPSGTTRHERAMTSVRHLPIPRELSLRTEDHYYRFLLGVGSLWKLHRLAGAEDPM